MKTSTTFAIATLALSIGSSPVHAQDDAGIRVKAPKVDIQIDVGDRDRERTQRIERAKAVLVPIGNSDVSGTVYFDRADETIRITGTVKGLEPGKHGFHVHRYGDLSDREKGLSAGGHFPRTASTALRTKRSGTSEIWETSRPTRKASRRSIKRTP